MEFVGENDLLGGSSYHSLVSTNIGAEFDGQETTSFPLKTNNLSSNDSQDERVVSDWQRTYSNEEDIPRQSTKAVASSSSSPQRLERSGKRKVSFAESTIIREADTIASSVPSHQYVKTVGHTQYHVQLIFRGFHWSITKRYRDFENFHKQICAETEDAHTLIPELPKKRWFERQRWLNRFDETYSRNRRIALQSYLRTVLRTFEFYEKQELFTEFLLIPEEALKVDNNAQYVQQTPVIQHPFPKHQIDFSEEDPYGSFAYRSVIDVGNEGPPRQSEIKATLDMIGEDEEQEDDVEQISNSDSDDEW